VYIFERTTTTNQPTRDEFDRLADRVKRIEQKTEEIKVTRVEVASADVVTQLKTLEQGQQETNKKLDSTQQDVNVLKIEMQGTRADILQIRELQADLRDKIIEHGQYLKAIDDKQEAQTETLGSLLDFAESHDETLKNAATKDDLAAMETRLIETMKQLQQQNRPES
jgi:chromosome segregation ATPase